MKHVEHATVQVSFPCVHGVARSQFISINCFPSEDLKSRIKVVAGIEDEIAERCICAGRGIETPETADLGVMALFSNPLFNGESYGLALAVADKMARFGKLKDWSAIYATGVLSPAQTGEVEAIDFFQEKLDLLIAQGVTNSLFLYPQANLDGVDDVVFDRIETLQAAKVDCLAVSNINELHGKVIPKLPDALKNGSKVFRLLNRFF